MSYSTFLALSWSVSRGRGTYGYNIARLDDRNTDERFRTCGGGYDMVGTVFGMWLEQTFQDELVELAQQTRQSSGEHLSEGGRWVKVPGFYGMTYDREGTDKKPVNVTLDGACGFSSMQAIAEAIGLDVTRSGNKRGQTVGFFVSSRDVSPSNA